MKIRFREPTNEGLGLKRTEARAKKLDTVRQKYNRMRLAAIIVSASWLLREIWQLYN